MLKKMICVVLVLLMVCPIALAQEKPSVALLVAGSLGDRSFSDSAYEGLMRLERELGLKVKVMECNRESDCFKQKVWEAAQEYDVVVAISYEFEAGLREVAPLMPDVKFIQVENVLTGIENVMCINFAQNEGSFLVGYIAAKLSATDTVGAMVGMDLPNMNEFVVGFEAGAKYAGENTKVLVRYAGTFEDPAAGEAQTLALYEEGCDVVFGVAGKTGDGVFAAAKDKGIYVIGVDQDQKYIDPEHIACSMVKEVGEVVFASVADYVNNGAFRGGENWQATMAAGFVSVGYGDETMPQQVNEELKKEVEALSQRIMDGTIVVPSVYDK